ncbi:S-adenosylmethionine decarboxylase proenzyme [Shewanella sp. Isolate11]|uniref:S-adenosylmethionine decarboxylase proenzyme n=1 Tax=Shewanella sp. Isolate11 TaxID=2908530 RepID=UPI001EFE16F6|nr:S-adenosylmethionine decarboxylase proenzyme [Shewanella sp. Isolate11]MCG9696958.1 S-adenosylmethionine decarboxylase proenzyme [Shewanella sp. Isolate11]
MFFEGAEKRIEIVIDESQTGFRDREILFWQTVLAKAGASILSKTTHNYCDAYVLSESSLFVWQHKLILITCGNTSLIDTTLAILTSVGCENIKGFSYQRKSELYAHLQSSRFEDDVWQLRQHIAGKAYRLGHLDSHHHYLFTYGEEALSRHFSGLQLFHIRGEFAEYLRAETQSKQYIFQQLGLAERLPDFQFDDHLFTPYGYSLNGVLEQQYLTLHITPQLPNCYISIETNIEQDELVCSLFDVLLTAFNPSRWDMINIDSTKLIGLANTVAKDAQHLSQIQLSIGRQKTVFINHYKQLDCEHLVPVELT